MKVQEVLLENNMKRYMLLDDKGLLVLPVMKYIKYLDTRGKSPNTQKTYCYALKEYFTFLEDVNLGYKDVRLEDLVDFIAWLRNPYGINKAVPLQPTEARKKENTINLILTAVNGFYDYLYRNEELDKAMVDLVTKEQLFKGAKRAYRDFLYHVNQNSPSHKNVLRVKKRKVKLKVLSKMEVEMLYNGATNIRDKLLIQKWLKYRLLSNDLTWGTAVNYMVSIPKFLDFIFELEPTWKNLNELSRSHFEEYLDLLHKENAERQRVTYSYEYVTKAISSANKFLEGLQTINSPLAPKKDVRMIIFRYDRPKKKKKSKKVKYIPDSVLQQLFDNINYLHEEVQPIIWISFKTGLRVSDTLRLTQDCLLRINGKYQLISDVTKTCLKDHSIPIDDELADVIAVLIKNSKENSNEENNPQNYIFVRYRGVRKGRPYSADWIGERLNSLAKEKKIVDEKGEIYHFRMHQFRHTYAVKMLNSGADFFTVQQLLAHSSPEMTLVYARLLDTTKRKVFEEAMKQGLFSFDVNGEMKQIKPNEEIPEDILEVLWREQKLSAVDNPYGTCHARINGNCPHAEEPPCLTCNGGSPCKDLAIGFSELDIQKYELLVKTSSRTIEVLEQRGRQDIAEKNKKNLERYQNILNTIQSGKFIFGRLDSIKRKQGLANV